jgi:hypothetical protein
MTLWLIKYGAIGFLVLLALVALSFVVRGAVTKRHVREAARVIVGLICMVLIGLSSRGNIGPWGAWVGFGVAIGSVAVAFLT